MNKLYVILTVLFVLLAFILPAYASDDEVNMMDLPKYLSEKLGLPTSGDYFAGKILAGIIVLMMFLLPSLVISRRPYAQIFAGLTGLAFTVALGWMPVWIFVIICLILGLMYAQILADAFGRVRGGGE